MEIRGRIIQALTPQSGTSASGRAWKKQEFVLETFDQYPRKVVFTIFGDKVDQMAPSFQNFMSNGTDVTISFDLESRAFMGRDGVERWSTEVRPWKIVESATLQVPGYDAQMAAPGFAPQPQAAPAFAPQAAPVFASPEPAVPQFPASEPAAAGTEDLPF